MTQGEEHRILETQGRFTMAVKNGQELTDFSWSKGRILLSNKRIILTSDAGNRTIPLSDLTGISGAAGSSKSIGALSTYLNLWLGEDMLVVSAEDHIEFRTGLYSTLIGEGVLKAKHPAVEGGVIQDESWENARLSVGPKSLTATLQSGTRAEFVLDAISSVQTEKRTVGGKKRRIVAVSHAIDGRNIETHLTGPPQTQLFAKSFLKHGERGNEIDADLEPEEEEVLMALYSGVSPFKIPEFIGRDVAEVEATYERLIELDILDRVRVRNEVTLTTSGRNIASDAMGEQ